MISRISRQLFATCKQNLNKTSVRTCYPYDHQMMVTMPRTKISKYEKLFWFLFFNFAIVSYPVYVFYYIPEYAGIPRETGPYVKLPEDE